jgi:N-acetylglucosamine kinase-like BadF-type ATPase
MSVFVGVDGGGTKTTAVVIDAQRTVLGECTSGPSNHNSVGASAARTEVLNAIHGALAAGKLTKNDAAGVTLCMSGVDRPSDKIMVKSWMTDDLPAGVRVCVDNDACAALGAGTDGKLCGVALISGTGTICVGFDRTGTQLRATGWGPALGDEGSGHALGAHALKAVVMAADGMAPPTLLTQLVLQQLALNDANELIPWAYAPEGKGEWHRTAALGRAVYGAAALGDAAATRILNSAARHLADAVECVCRRLYVADGVGAGMTPPAVAIDVDGADTTSKLLLQCSYDIVLSGGNLTNDDDALRRRVTALLRCVWFVVPRSRTPTLDSISLPRCRVLRQSQSAAMGAALIARRG